MPRKSIVAVDIIWEFPMPKQMQISTEAARGNLIQTDVSKEWLLLLKRHLKICL